MLDGFKSSNPMRRQYLRGHAVTVRPFVGWDPLSLNENGRTHASDASCANPGTARFPATRWPFTSHGYPILSRTIPRWRSPCVLHFGIVRLDPAPRRNTRTVHGAPYRTVLFQLTDAIAARNRHLHHGPRKYTVRRYHPVADFCSMARWLRIGFPRLIVAAPRNPLSPPGLRCRKELDDLKSPGPHILAEP